MVHLSSSLAYCFSTHKYQSINAIFMILDLTQLLPLKKFILFRGKKSKRQSFSYCNFSWLENLIQLLAFQIFLRLLLIGLFRVI